MRHPNIPYPIYYLPYPIYTSDGSGESSNCGDTTVVVQGYKWYVGNIRLIGLFRVGYCTNKYTFHFISALTPHVFISLYYIYKTYFGIFS